MATMLGDMSYEEKVCLWACGYMQDGPYKPTEEGAALLACLKASGFTPNEKDLKRWVSFMETAA
jgi:hypothetical protein